MVRPIVIAGTLALALIASASGELDLTPTETFYEIEGIRSPNLTFHDGSKPVTYTPPAKWTLSGGGRKLTFMPPDKVQEGAIFESALVDDPLAVKERALKAEHK